MGLNINFSCIGCGKCCTGSTLLTFSEMVRFASIFPVGTSWNPLPSKKTMDRKHFQHLRDMSISAKRSDGTIVRILPSIATMTPGNLPCPARRPDMLCSVHGDGKPQACVTAPLSYAQPADQKYDRLPPMLSQCPPEALQGPVLLRNGSVEQSEHRLGLMAAKKSVEGDRPLMVRALETLLDLKQAYGTWSSPLDETLSTTIGDRHRSTIITSEGIWPVISAAFELKIISKEEALAITSAQIDVCERYVDEWRTSQEAVSVLVKQIRDLRGLVRFYESV